MEGNKDLPFHIKFGNFISRDISFSLSLGYILLILIGMEFSHAYYDRWGIDIFEFADLTYFLLSPLQDIRVVLFALISIILLMLIYWLQWKYDIGKGKFSRLLNFGFRPGTKAYGYYNALNYLLGVLLYIHGSAGLLAFIKASGFTSRPQNRQKWVIIQPLKENEAPQRKRLLGMTNTYVFVVDSALKKAEALPVENRVIAIESSVPDSKDRQAASLLFPF